MSAPIEVLGLSARAENGLKAENINTVEEAIHRLKDGGRSSLLRIPKFGAFSANEVIGSLFFYMLRQGDNPTPTTNTGKTLRDEFAAIAMQFELERLKDALTDPDCDFDCWEGVQEYAAQCAYSAADAMMEARKK